MSEIAAQQLIPIPTIAIKYPHTKHRITSDTAPLFPFPIFPNNSSSTHHTKRISTPHLSPCAFVQDSALAATAKKARRSCAVSLGLNLGLIFRLYLVSCFLFLVSCFLFLVSCFLFLVSCFLFLVSCFLFLVSCFLFCVLFRVHVQHLIV